MQRRISVLTLGAMVAFATTAQAQTPFRPAGAESKHAGFSPLPNESVDPASGALTIVATDLVLPGNAGFDLRVTRIYNSSLHPDYDTGSTALEEDSWAGGGWRLHFGRVINPNSTTGGALDGLDLVGLILDGVHIGDHCLIVALGIAADGEKHALGLWDGSTENARVCQDLLANLQSRGLRTDRSLLVILDGSKALRKAVRTTFGEAALVQRCQVHKTRNILEYLSDRDRTWAHALLRRAYQATDLKTGQRLLLDLARRLEAEYPSAAASVREGLDETLTVLTLKLSPRLRRSLATTNAVESLISRTRLVKRNVKRWRGGQMMLRWVAAGVLEAVKGFRRLKGYADMPTLVTALKARDRQLGLATAEDDRQVA